MAYRLGVDVGGTFTDLLLHDSDGGRVWLAKTPSTPEDQSRGVLNGIALITEQAGIEAGALDQILHGTTVATNAVLERRGARVGLIATDGFRYLLHLAEAWTPGPLFGFMVYDKPEPLVALEDVREAPERINGSGGVVRELDEDAVRTAITELRDDGVAALCVSLMNSFANPDHEQRIAAIAAEVAPDLPLSISSEILPEFREYERATTTVVNAYVAPALKKYLYNLRDGLAANGTTAGLQVVRSDGGLMSLEAASEMPVHTVLSGPAGGVGGATFVGDRAGYDRLLTFDMGGTSTDVAACIGGLPTITRETRVGDFPVRAPAVEVESIGAGGGSIAFIQAATGALRVGPQSAGAQPGPACYGRGGVEPTVTDANVVLGHLPPRLLGGAMELDVEAAHAAVRRVADPLGIDVHEAARGIVDLVNEAMLGALRVVTVQRGQEPSSFALVSFGGAGGLHANALAALLGSYPLIVPSQSGVLSALGFVSSDVRNEVSQTLIGSVASLDAGEVRSTFGDLTGQATAWLDGEGIAQADQRIEYLVDMRYERQGFEIPVELEAGELGDLDLERLAGRFAERHRQVYGFDLEGGAEIVCLRAVAWGGVPAPELAPGATGPADPSAAQRGTHTVHAAGGAVEVPTYDRAQLKPGMVFDGYAIVEQYDSTTVVLPGHTATVDPYLNLIIRPTEARS
jgi:N-methylhydantoinase A